MTLDPNQIVVNYYDIVRMLNIFMGLVMFGLIMYRYLKWKLDFRLRILRLGLMGLIVSIITPSISFVFLGIHAGPWVIPATVSFVWLYVAYFWDYLPGDHIGKASEKDRHETDPLSRRL